MILWINEGIPRNVYQNPCTMGIIKSMMHCRLYSNFNAIYKTTYCMHLFMHGQWPYIIDIIMLSIAKQANEDIPSRSILNGAWVRAVMLNKNTSISRLDKAAAARAAEGPGNQRNAFGCQHGHQWMPPPESTSNIIKSVYVRLQAWISSCLKTLLAFSAVSILLLVVIVIFFVPIIHEPNQ